MWRLIGAISMRISRLPNKYCFIKEFKLKSHYNKLMSTSKNNPQNIHFIKKSKQEEMDGNVICIFGHILIVLSQMTNDAYPHELHNARSTKCGKSLNIARHKSRLKITIDPGINSI